MITATFYRGTINEKGPILQWEYSDTHLTREHMKAIKNVGFGEFRNNNNHAFCEIKVNDVFKATYHLIINDGMITCTLFSRDSKNSCTKTYSAANCLY